MRALPSLHPGRHLRHDGRRPGRRLRRTIHEMLVHRIRHDPRHTLLRRIHDRQTCADPHGLPVAPCRPSPPPKPHHPQQNRSRDPGSCGRIHVGKILTNPVFSVKPSPVKIPFPQDRESPRTLPPGSRRLRLLYPIPPPAASLLLPDIPPGPLRPLRRTPSAIPGCRNSDPVPVRLRPPPPSPPEWKRRTRNPPPPSAGSAAPDGACRRGTSASETAR